MAEHIASGSGTAYPLIINADGSINVSGAAFVTAGSLAVQTVSQSGNFIIYENTLGIMYGTVFTSGITATFTNATSGTALQVVAAGAGSKIRVISYMGIAKSGADIVFKDNATELTGWKYLTTNTGWVSNYNPLGHFETAAGGSVCLISNSTGSVSGEMRYIRIV
jgi:hypothetical protein